MQSCTWRQQQGPWPRSMDRGPHGSVATAAAGEAAAAACLTPHLQHHIVQAVQHLQPTWQAALTTQAGAGASSGQTGQVHGARMHSMGSCAQVPQGCLRHALHAGCPWLPHDLPLCLLPSSQAPAPPTMPFSTASVPACAVAARQTCNQSCKPTGCLCAQLARQLACSGAALPGESSRWQHAPHHSSAQTWPSRQSLGAGGARGCSAAVLICCTMCTRQGGVSAATHTSMGLWHGP